MKWESFDASAGEREAAQEGPGKRWGHTCNAVGRTLLFLFGGYGADSCQTKDVHVFDTVKQTWSKPTMKGNPPSPRDSHSCTTVGSRLFVFGGTDGSSPLKDLHILDTATYQWIMPTISGEGPPAREGHSAVLVGKRIFIFGGCGKSINNHEEVYYNDLHILDTEALAWERARTFGTPPCPRDSHTCSSWGNNIIVIGGEDSSDCYLSDVHMLDADNLVWKQLNTSGQLIAPRAGHVTVAVGSNLFVFGGFSDARNLFDDLHVLNVENGTWTRITSLDKGPSARFSVAGDCLDESTGVIVFIGGCNKSLEALDDMYYLHTDMPVRYSAPEQSQETSFIRRESKKKCTDNYPLAKERGKDKDMTMLEVQAASSQPMYLQGCSSAGSGSISGKLTFEARIVDSTQYAYTIETTICGQNLRGVIISSAPCSVEDSQAYPNKRRVAIDGEGSKVIETQPVLSAAPVIQGLIATAHEKEPLACAQPTGILSVNSATKAGGNVESLLMATDDLKSDRHNMGPSNLLSANMKNYSGNAVQFPKASENLENDPIDSETPLLSTGGLTDPKDFEAPLFPTEGPKNDQEKFEPLLIISEDLSADTEAIPSSSWQGAREHDSSMNI